MDEELRGLTVASAEQIREALPIAKRLLKHFKEAQLELVVFDFDYTILNIHAFHERIRQAERVRERDVVRDFADWPVFYSLVTLLGREEALLSGVASFGYQAVVLEYMRLAFAAQTAALRNEGVEQELLAPSDFFTAENVVSSAETWKENVSKAKMLAELSTWFSARTGRDVTSRSAVVLFDDTKSNCETVKKRGYEAVFVPVEGVCGPGMNRCFWEGLLAH